MFSVPGSPLRVVSLGKDFGAVKGRHMAWQLFRL